MDACSESDKFQVNWTNFKWFVPRARSGKVGKVPGNLAHLAGKSYPSIQDCIFTHSEAPDDGLGRARTMNVWALGSASMWYQHILYTTLSLVKYKMLHIFFIKVLEITTPQHVTSIQFTHLQHDSTGQCWTFPVNKCRLGCRNTNCRQHLKMFTNVSDTTGTRGSVC